MIRSGQQVLLAHDAQRFFKKVEFDPPEQGDVRRLHPAGLASPVVIDPLVRFGRASVQGVATDRLWELFDAGESIEQIADGYEMPAEQIAPQSPTRSSCVLWWHSRTWRPGFR
ncbi:MAG: DUF433 domain-containing protein [Actinomycetota bacterium]|nr:DUF433 domain-containing protein [Actinomycetota bacterium]